MFLCDAGQSRNEHKLLAAGWDWGRLPAIDDQALIDVMGMRNMVARRRFLQAVVDKFGEKVVRRARRGGVRGDDSSSSGSDSEEEW